MQAKSCKSYCKEPPLLAFVLLDRHSLAARPCVWRFHRSRELCSQHPPGRTLSEGFGEAFQKEPKFIVRKLRNLANLMCSLSPSERPTALKACQKLDTLGEAIN